MVKYKVTVDRNLCIGAGSCVAVAPLAFALDNEAKAILTPCLRRQVSLKKRGDIKIILEFITSVLVPTAMNLSMVCPAAAMHTAKIAVTKIPVVVIRLLY
ncbi:MAG: hypothetical protein UV55_C0016G0027 [Candidatus Gottesmanbacteria bacterium GW2011_GWC1_43_10]|nr:MAG: hypothetical protein UV55_C0016G0027 [Candidatus Gottesmanbacteria bacterium GW2011_GWC1_43_10]